ncbi:hypothetical protein [Calothrix sp. NIES-3974]|uniref:hypothetical protein n=1 Tax=Calothrix sp. NIES-3974 TaxID=2005462 RepID=UPI000B6025B5|nr:hypothetical protein [Calothrix sp. NIES-3974]BAZ03459.1 hypothetical protein NIES3974_00850 [Calothrix sp. NIES-3974]
MFLDELKPLFQQFTKHPASFMGGFVSGVLRLSLKDEPVKSWLSQKVTTNSTSNNQDHHNGKGSGPQSISID